MLVSMKGNMLDPELVDAFSAILAEENSFSGGHQ